MKSIRLAGMALAAALGMASAASGDSEAVLLADDFDAGTAAGQWSVWSYGGDCVVDFAYDYSVRGIPAAPHSVGGTTRGLWMMVNGSDAVAAKDAVSVYPAGRVFSGDQTLRCDMWLNYNGGAGGGTGSTQFAMFGLHHHADRVVWSDNTASDGIWNAVSGEGGAADDYRAYSGATLQAAGTGGYAAGGRDHTAALYQTLFPAPPYETAGAPGKQWVEVEVRRRGAVVEWRLNGRQLTMRVDTTAMSGDVMLGQMDPYASIAVPPEDNFVLFDNVRVVAPDCNGNGVADQQDLAAGTSADCNGDGLPDECEAIANGDFDADGDTDAADLAALGTVMAGPGVTPGLPDGRCVTAYRAAFDANGDAAFDVADVRTLQQHGTRGVFADRAAGAVVGSEFLASVVGLDRATREARVVQQILGGNVPGFLRTFVPITVSATIDGVFTQATYEVAPDYLSIGLDRDFVRMPMSPAIAQTIADGLGCLLPTRKMVDQIYTAAAVKLAPAPISPTTVDIMLPTTFFRHHEMVETQRQGYALGPLVGGIKKDVVITPRLVTTPGKVAIYGWHQLNGTPIQPLYLGHEATYMDYSHGFRLVRNRIVVNGVEMTVAEVLAHPTLNVLLSDEGVVTTPRYPTAQ